MLLTTNLLFLPPSSLPLPSAVFASLLALSVRERLQNNAEFIWSCFLRNVYQVYQVLLSTVSSFFGNGICGNISYFDSC